MEPQLKYKVIKSKEQYMEYCDKLMNLLELKGNEDEIDLLTVLIDKYDEEQDSFKNVNVDPVQLLKALMTEHQLQAKDLTEILGVSKGLISDILNYKKGFSKEVIRKLAERFKLSQEAFNQPYKLKPASVAKPKRKIRASSTKRTV
jgi:HTH-type transcriptional regulator/antitoxin HigA